MGGWTKSAADVAASLADALEELPGSSAALIDVLDAIWDAVQVHPVSSTRF
jgi:hypothetical protein